MVKDCDGDLDRQILTRVLELEEKTVLDEGRLLTFLVPWTS